MEKSIFKPETNKHLGFFKSKAQIWIIKLQLTETYKYDIETFLGLHDEFILTTPKLWVPKNSKMKKQSKERGKNLDLAVYLLSKRIRLMEKPKGITKN